MLPVSGGPGCRLGYISSDEAAAADTTSLIEVWADQKRSEVIGYFHVGGLGWFTPEEVEAPRFRERFEAMATEAAATNLILG